MYMVMGLSGLSDSSQRSWATIAAEVVSSIAPLRHTIRSWDGQTWLHSTCVKVRPGRTCSSFEKMSASLRFGQRPARDRKGLAQDIHVRHPPACRVSQSPYGNKSTVEFKAYCDLCNVWHGDVAHGPQRCPRTGAGELGEASACRGRANPSQNAHCRSWGVHDLSDLNTLKRELSVVVLEILPGWVKRRDLLQRLAITVRVRCSELQAGK